jgi:hypothetical protein
MSRRRSVLAIGDRISLDPKTLFGHCSTLLFIIKQHEQKEHKRLSTKLGLSLPDLGLVSPSDQEQ